MKKFLLLAALPLLFATYSNAATPKYDARPNPPQHYCPLRRKRHQKLNALMV